MPSPVVDVVRDLAAVLGAHGVRWYVFGAQAAILHGATRLSADVDVTVDFEGQSASDVVRSLAEGGFELRVADVDGFVEKTRVIPIVHTRTRMPVDLVLSGPGLEELFFERAQTMTIEGVRVVVASAEDLVVMKVLAGRPKDIEDVTAILKAKGAAFDVARARDTLKLVESAINPS
jgi:hypothetical protein